MSSIRKLFSLAAVVLFRLATRVPVIAIAVTVLVCLAPGFYSDERLLDPRLSADTIQRIEAERGSSRTPFMSGFEYLIRAARGDFGYSNTFARPVLQLLRDRAPVTFYAAILAISAGWTAALLFAVCRTGLRSPALTALPVGITAMVLCTPAALLGFLASIIRVPIASALAAVVFARVYTYADKLLRQALSEPHITAARALGTSRTRILAVHVLPAMLPQFLAVMAGSVSLVLGAAVAIETICDVPGLGQLAWKATTNRDLPLLLGVTMLVSSISIAAATISDICAGEWSLGAA